MARNFHCLVCNTEIDILQGGRFSVVLTYPQKPEGRLNPPTYLVHEECARSVAHPEFNLSEVFLGEP
jgi:hypothetical protein